MRRRPAHRPWRGSQAAATSPSTAITPSTATSPSTATAAASPAGESRLAADGPARPGPSLVQHSGPGPRLGPLAALLRDPEVTDILVNGPDSVWVERAGRLRPTGVRFADDAAVRGLAVRLAASSGRRLDTAMPFADIRLRDGIRLHAMLSPPALGGTCLSLRRPRAVPFTLDDLAAAGTVGPRAATVLRAVLTARLTALISGGTGTGKSTLLAALLDAVPATERVVLVE
ncbi:ATPase, T2SS/T4P/T4SS family, partial [Frankia sp. EI5c]|uniref:ATPase, T2SS/T4P/T4SS family n=1 Tax=Frankia sp. EI5c TaxID=683316 RepID=UPI001F5B8CF8